MTRVHNTVNDFKGRLKEIFKPGDLVIWRDCDLKARGSVLTHQVGKVIQVTDYIVTFQFRSNRFACSMIDVFRGALVKLDEVHKRIYNAVIALDVSTTNELFKALTQEDLVKRQESVCLIEGLCDFGISVEEMCTDYHLFILCSCFWSYGSKKPRMSTNLDDVEEMETTYANGHGRIRRDWVYKTDTKVSTGRLSIPEYTFVVTEPYGFDLGARVATGDVARGYRGYIGYE